MQAKCPAREARIIGAAAVDMNEDGYLRASCADAMKLWSLRALPRG